MTGNAGEVRSYGTVVFYDIDRIGRDDVAAIREYMLANCNGYFFEEVQAAALEAFESLENLGAFDVFEDDFEAKDYAPLRTLWHGSLALW